MMSQSARFTRLSTQINKLRSHFLPIEFDQTGNYDEKTLALTAAYRVLTHAEIEEYIEKRCQEKAQEAIRNWDESQKPSRTLLGLLGFCGLMMTPPPESLKPIKQNIDNWNEKLMLTNKIKSSYNAFFNVIQQNHGIKEENLLRLLLPIGLNTDDIDPVFLSAMNSFGEGRGHLAHESAATYQLTQQLNPQDELNTVTKIVDELEKIDLAIESL